MTDNNSSETLLTPKPPAGGDAGVLIEGVKRVLQNPDGEHDGWTDAGLKHAFFRWPTIVHAINAALALSAPVVEGEVQELREEVTRLRKVAAPLWFYPADGHESDHCMWSVEEVIDYADLPPGNHVVEVNAATPLPSIWCAVRVTADEDADERYTFTPHATADAARAALSEGDVA